MSLARRALARGGPGTLGSAFPSFHPWRLVPEEAGHQARVPLSIQQSPEWGTGQAGCLTQPGPVHAFGAPGGGERETGSRVCGCRSGPPSLRGFPKPPHPLTVFVREPFGSYPELFLIFSTYLQRCMNQAC